MATGQYRKGGGNTILLYRKLITLCGKDFWRKQETVTYREYDVTTDICKHIKALEELTCKYEHLVADRKEIERKIKDGRQEDPNHSDPEVMIMPKDSKKFKKRRGECDRSIWQPFISLVCDIYGRNTSHDVRVKNATVISSASVERVAVSQEIGDPQRNNGGKGKQNQQNQQNNRRSRFD